MVALGPETSFGAPYRLYQAMCPSYFIPNAHSSRRLKCIEHKIGSDTFSLSESKNFNTNLSVESGHYNGIQNSKNTLQTLFTATTGLVL
jgi:hypothetical protein